MKKKKKLACSMVLAMNPLELDLYLADSYQQAMRVGSLRAVEDRRGLGRMRLYRWAKAKGLPLNRLREIRH